jgi:hypothetical protein
MFFLNKSYQSLISVAGRACTQLQFFVDFLSHLNYVCVIEMELSQATREKFGKIKGKRHRLSRRLTFNYKMLEYCPFFTPYYY